MQKHKIKLADELKWAEELERVLFILNNQAEHIQSQILGCLYAGYIDTKINWSTFCEMSEANRRMFAVDYTLLSNVYQISTKAQSASIYQFDRLISLDLLRRKAKPPAYFGSEPDSVPPEDTAEDVLSTTAPTEFGRTFCDLTRYVLEQLV